MNSAKPDLTLPKGVNLSEHLNAVNSTVLFGCRMGICGTCLCQVQSSTALIAPDDQELETLSVYAPDNPKARLACQLKLESDISLEPIEHDESF